MPLKHLQNLPLWEHKLSKEQLEPIWREVDSMQSADYKDYKTASPQLVGDLEHQYFLKDSLPDLDATVQEQINLWEDQSRYLASMNYNSGKHAIRSLGAWVNFQSKGENNPLHSHGGVVSWVLWLKIPYTIEQEREYLSRQPTTQTQLFVGQFALVYTNILGNVEMTAWDSDEMEGTLLLFPSKLKHAVYPFYSTDEKRITISGNYAFNTDHVYQNVDINETR
tara:strand:+ start:1147 stop:1815 length:669 start_codon:yes stop_codon:yes gene_type:complete